MQHHSHSMPVTSGDQLDPVCGMTVSKEGAAGHHEYKGKTYYFCSKGCLERFKNDPEQYLRPKVRIEASAPVRIEMPPAAAGGEWTCPMHPEVVQKGPGSCPICGMALEPRTVTLETLHEENPELRDMSRRFFWSLALTAPILALMI